MQFILQAATAPQIPFYSEPSFLLLLIGIMLVVNFFILKPRQKKQEAEQAELVLNMPKGSSVVTNSGIHGKLFKVDEDTVVLEVEGGTRIRFDKTAVNFERTKTLNAPAAK